MNEICVRRFLTSVNASNCYLCWCSRTLDGIIIDPAEFTEQMRQFIEDEQINLVGVFITHGHYDHNSAANEISLKYKIAIYAGGNYPGGKKVETDDVLEVGSCLFYVANTPGHTEDSISLIGEGIAFVGDALFAAAVGGTSSRAYFERETEGLREHILSLPGCTTIYPGHGPATTVAVENIFNPFFL